MWTPPGYPVVAFSWRSCSSGSAGLALSHVQTICTGYRCWSRSSQSPGGGGCTVAELVSPLFSFIRRASSPALLWLGHSMLTSAGGRGSSPAIMSLRMPHLHPCLWRQFHCAAQSIAAACEGLGQLSCSHILGARPYCPGNV